MKNKFFYVQIAVLALLFAFAAGCNRAATKTDAQIASDVQARINADANLPNKAITVNANNGTVTLSGTVATEAERMTAANDASSVEGVKQVVNNLTVNPTAAGMAPGTVGDAPPPSGATSAPATSGTRATTTRGTSPSGADRAAVPSGSSAAAPARATTTTANTLTVPQGADITIRLIDTIDSEKAENGQTFRATVDDPIYVGDRVAIPGNADVEGRIIDVKSAGKFKGRSELTLELTRVSYGGRSYDIDTTTVQKYGASRGKNTAAKVGGGAAAGAIIGGIIGGGKGAAIGAGAGAAAGTGAQAITKGEQIVLRPETLLSFSLKTPVNVAPASAARVR